MALLSIITGKKSEVRIQRAAKTLGERERCVGEEVTCPVCQKPARNHNWSKSFEFKLELRSRCYCPRCGISFRLSLFSSCWRKIRSGAGRILFGSCSEKESFEPVISAHQREANYRRMLDIDITPACLSEGTREKKEDYTPLRSHHSPHPGQETF